MEGWLWKGWLLTGYVAAFVLGMVVGGPPPEPPGSTPEPVVEIPAGELLGCHAEWKARITEAGCIEIVEHPAHSHSP